MSKQTRKRPAAHVIACLCLSILIAAALSGCSKAKKGGESYIGEKVVTKQHELLEKHISDPEKQVLLFAILEDIQTTFEEFDVETYRPWVEKRTSLFRSYGTSDNEFDKLGVEYDDNFSVLFESILKKRAEMKALTTPKEWKKISDV